MIESGQREPAFLLKFTMIRREWFADWLTPFLLLMYLPVFMLLVSIYLIWLMYMVLITIYAVILGMACLVMSGVCLVRALRLLQRWCLARSTVTGFEERDSQSSTGYTLTFLTKTEQPMTIRDAIILTCPSPLDLKGAFILYNPETLTVFKLFAFGPIWGETIIWTWIGWGCIYLGSRGGLTSAFTNEGILMMLLNMLVLPPCVFFLMFILFYSYRHHRLRVERLA